MKAIRTGVAASALVVSLAPAVLAQSAGSISGTVLDGSGAALPGATVTASNPAQAVTQTAATNSAGVFLLPQLPPGTYSVAAELTGFKRIEKSNVILSTRSAINIGDFVLEVGDMAETVTVEAETGRLQIQSESAERSDLVTNKQLRDLALNGRNISDLFKTIPGVIAGGTITTSTVQNGKRMLQLRLEMFNVLNHTQFSGYNLTTNVTNGAGQTGAAIFNDYTNLSVTNSTRPAGDTRPLGTFFGEYNAVRDPRIIQLAAKLYF